MSQAVETSTALISNPQISVETMERFQAGRTGFFAGISGQLRAALRLDEAEALQRSGSVKPVSECLREVDTPWGEQLLRETLARKPLPRFEPAPDRANYWVRIDANGTRTIERSFVAGS